jgi:hypothetical protein
VEERLQLPFGFALGLVSVIAVTVPIATAEMASDKDKPIQGVKVSREKSRCSQPGELDAVIYATAHLCNPEVEGIVLSNGYLLSSLLEENYDNYRPYSIGTGNVSLDDPSDLDSGNAWIILGQLAPQGSRAGSGEDSGNRSIGK